MDTADGRCVVRLPAGAAADATREQRATEAAHAAGVGPPVLDAVAGVLVVGWLDGRALSAADLSDGAVLDRVATAAARLHAGPLLGVRTDTVAAVLGYLAEARRRGLALPPGYLDSAPAVEQVAAALAARPELLVPCHNDLVPANLLDDGERVRFVDFEHAADADPCAELGNLAGEADLDAARTAHLVEAYTRRSATAGGPAPRRLARTRLYALLTLYGWVAWASARDAEPYTPEPYAAEPYAAEPHIPQPGAPEPAAASTRPARPDWRSWAHERAERAYERLAAPDLPALLDDATR